MIEEEMKRGVDLDLGAAISDEVGRRESAGGGELEGVGLEITSFLDQANTTLDADI